MTSLNSLRHQPFYVFLLLFIFLGSASICLAKDTKPEVIRQHAPVYPPDLQRLGEEGHVTVEFIIDESGDVSEAHVSKESESAPWQFKYAAVVSVWQWKFKPGKKDGIPVKIRTVVTVDFSLKN